jgi:high frequency lysogenization protein
MRNVWHNRTLALAGILQALHSVQQIARHGNAPTDAIATSLASVFKINPESAEDVYGGIGGLSLGLQLLSQQLNRKRYRTDPELLRYLINIMYLEKRLRNRPKILAKIADQIKLLEQQRGDIFSIHPDTIARLADIYLNTISTLTPRIQIRGEETHLRQPENIERVRALLLAGIRSAVLWRQMGGSRLHLLFYSRQLLQETQILTQRLSEADSAKE